jgi:pyruvate dehydrogenase E2 component (dihydrolipoamide acetyltransferase)
MRIAVVMPQLGLTMEEGTVSAWLKKTGDAVKKDELLFSISTDKVEMDVESVAEGILDEIIEPASRTVPVGTVLAYIEGVGADGARAVSEQAVSSTREEHSAVREVRVSLPTISTPGDDGKDSGRTAGPRRLASPRAKRLAKELGVDLAGVRGKSLDGQITEEDVRLASEQTNVPSRSGGGRRQLIAERLTRSVQTIPTFSVAAEVNAENLVALHESLKTSEALRASPSKGPGVKLTITDLLLNVFARALKSSPEVNATWEENQVRHRTAVDLGLAVATAKGVVAPVIRNVDAIDLLALAVRRSELVEKTRLGRLSLAELEGGVGTLSNLGMYRVDHFQGIISPGQSSILAVGQIRERPWVDKTLMIKRTLMLNLTVDHRVADGAAAAVLLGKMIELIEDPHDLRWKLNSSPGNGADRRSNG